MAAEERRRCTQQGPGEPGKPAAEAAGKPAAEAPGKPAAEAPGTRLAEAPGTRLAEAVDRPPAGVHGKPAAGRTTQAAERSPPSPRFEAHLWACSPFEGQHNLEQQGQTFHKKVEGRCKTGEAHWQRSPERLVQELVDPLSHQ